MKKKAIACLYLILAMLALFAMPAWAEGADPAAAPEEFTMQRFAETNSHAMLTARHSSYYVHIDYNGDYTIDTYGDSDLCYTLSSGDAIVYADGQLCEINDGTFAVRLYAGTEPNLEWTTGPITYAPEEELVEVVQEGENLLVKTRIPLQDGDEENAAAYSEFVYEVDGHDLCNLSGTCTSYTADGAAVYKASWQVEYNVQRPAQAQEMFDRMNPQEDYRTVAIVADPGTEAEITYSARALRGDTVRLYFSGNYQGFYTDPECTQAFVSGSSDPTQDLTLYAISAEK